MLTGQERGTLLLAIRAAELLPVKTLDWDDANEELSAGLASYGWSVDALCKAALNIVDAHSNDATMSPPRVYPAIQASPDLRRAAQEFLTYYIHRTRRRYLCGALEEYGGEGADLVREAVALALGYPFTDRTTLSDAMRRELRSVFFVDTSGAHASLNPRIYSGVPEDEPTTLRIRWLRRIVDDGIIDGMWYPTDLLTKGV